MKKKKNNKMKICIVTPNFLPKTGGTEIQTYHLAKKLVSKGYDITIITKKFNSKLKSKELIDGIKTIRIKIPKISFMGQIIFYINCLREINKIKPHLIHEQLISGVGVFVNIFRKIPFIVWTRGNDINSRNKLYKNIILPISLKKADKIITQTSIAKKKIISISKRKDVKIIPNFIIENIIPSKNRILDFIKKDEFVISTLSRLDEYKGIQDILQAIAIAKKAIKNIKFLIIGEGNYKNKLIALSKKLELDNVYFLGNKSQKESLEMIKNSNLFVFASYSEGFPNVLLEAMYASTPIITSNFEGVNDIITENRNGLIYEMKNYKHLAEKIKKLFDDKILRTKISKNNSQDIKQYFSEKIITQIEEIYFEIKKN